MANICYRIGFADEDRQRSAWVYDAAFGEKIAVAIPDKAQRLAVLAEGFDPSRAIAAMYRGRVVGLAGFHHRGGSLTSGITVSILRRHLGWIGMLRAISVFAFFERKPNPRELLMDGIAVDPAMQGQGIGTGLLEELSAYAETRGYGTIRLDVVDANEGAYRLYRRQGFVVIKRVDLAWLASILGFSGLSTMQKDIRRSMKGTQNI
ncbi:GNAT family N-acetyltransferase [Thioalkalivibrio sp. HK1]|uniref:GNAT family N-acetyltransferase n=1 Tax=Thioalkalivibrio sp. HK1 TaxID=1469245 RepID=UPI00046F537B|nr:GNAT family N-acetyltransferase [Thioalkalivibrio sp. HK1]